MTTNIDRAAEVIAESITRDSAPAHEIVADLEHDGLIMPDLPEPHVTKLDGFVYATFPGAGCAAPTGRFAPQFITIFGDEDCSDATLDAAEDRLTAIKPEDLDRLIACLLAVRAAADYAEGHGRGE